MLLNRATIRVLNPVHALGAGISSPLDSECQSCDPTRAGRWPFGKLQGIGMFIVTNLNKNRFKPQRGGTRPSATHCAAPLGLRVVVGVWVGYWIPLGVC